MKENMRPTPEDPYGVAKFAVEMDLYAAKHMFGLEYVIFRPHNVYGEYQNLGDKYRNVVGIFMNQLMQHKPLTIFGDGEQTRAFSYVGDIAPHIANSAELKSAYGEIINIGAEKNYTIKELADAVMKAMGVEGKIKFVEARNEVTHAHADHEKSNRLFGSDHFTSLDEGLTKMASWAKATGIKKSAKFKEIEIEENLPPLWLED